MRCGCEWHSGDQGAVMTICCVGRAELFLVTAVSVPGEWELQRARKAARARKAWDEKPVPKATLDAMRAYAVRKARLESKAKGISL